MKYYYDPNGNYKAYCNDEKHLYSESGDYLGYFLNGFFYNEHGESLGYIRGNWIYNNVGTAIYYTTS